MLWDVIKKKFVILMQNLEGNMLQKLRGWERSNETDLCTQTFLYLENKTIFREKKGNVMKENI